jgi:hypothetical protein
VGAESRIDGADVRAGEAVEASVVRADDVDVRLSAVLDLDDVRLDLALSRVEVRLRKRFQRFDPCRDVIETATDGARVGAGGALLGGADEEVGDSEVEEGDADEETGEGDSLATTNAGTKGLPCCYAVADSTFVELVVHAGDLWRAR